jgi:S-adenosylmethionine synthetase
VAENLARRCCIQISYGTQSALPVSIFINTYGTARASYEELEKVIYENFDMRPGVVALDLGLTEPIFTRTSRNGHFNDETQRWEQPKILNVDSTVLRCLVGLELDP